MAAVGLRYTRDFEGSLIPNSNKVATTQQFKQFNYGGKLKSYRWDQKYELKTHGMRWTLASRAGTLTPYQVFLDDHRVYQRAIKAHFFAREYKFWSPVNPADPVMKKSFAYGAAMGDRVGNFLAIGVSGSVGVITTALHRGRRYFMARPCLELVQKDSRIEQFLIDQVRENMTQEAFREMAAEAEEIEKGDLYVKSQSKLLTIPRNLSWFVLSELFKIPFLKKNDIFLAAFTIPLYPVAFINTCLAYLMGAVRCAVGFIFGAIAVPFGAIHFLGRRWYDEYQDRLYANQVQDNLVEESPVGPELVEVISDL